MEFHQTFSRQLNQPALQVKLPSSHKILSRNMRFTNKSPFLVVLLLTTAGLPTQPSLGPNSLEDDPDMDLEGMLIDDGPNNATSPPPSVLPSLTFTSALELQPPHPISLGTASPVTLPPVSPTTTSLPKANGTSPSLTTSGIGQVVATQTALPAVPRNSGSRRLNLTFSNLLGAVICLGSTWGPIRLL